MSAVILRFTLCVFVRIAGASCEGIAIVPVRFCAVAIFPFDSVEGVAIVNPWRFLGPCAIVRFDSVSVQAAHLSRAGRRPSFDAESVKVPALRLCGRGGRECECAGGARCGRSVVAVKAS